MSDYSTLLTDEQKRLFREDKPYNSPFKDLPWYGDNNYGVHSSGYHTGSMDKIYDAARDYWSSRDWN